MIASRPEHGAAATPGQSEATQDGRVAMPVAPRPAMHRYRCHATSGPRAPGNASATVTRPLQTNALHSSRCWKLSGKRGSDRPVPRASRIPPGSSHRATTTRAQSMIARSTPTASAWSKRRCTVSCRRCHGGLPRYRAPGRNWTLNSFLRMARESLRPSNYRSIAVSPSKVTAVVWHPALTGGVVAAACRFRNIPPAG
jgi:hypothetical protein